MNFNFILASIGSLKKRAPLPPATGIQMQSGAVMYGTLPSSHSRTPSDPVAAGYHTLSHTHKRSPSSDSTSGRSVIHLGTACNLYYNMLDKFLQASPEIFMC